MAPRPHQHQFFRPPRARNHARNLAVFRRAFPPRSRRRALRAELVPPEKARRLAPAPALLHLLPLFAAHRLQGPPHPLAVPPILRGPPRSFLRRHLRRFSPALFNQHAAFLASRTTFPLRRPQRRNQYHRLEPPLAALQIPRTPLPPYGGLVFSPSPRKRYPFR